jgi:hypothetical protein
MKTITYQAPIAKFDKATKTYVNDLITLYNVELVECWGVQTYEGTTTPKGKKLAWCCPSKVIQLQTI